MNIKKINRYLFLIIVHVITNYFNYLYTLCMLFNRYLLIDIMNQLYISLELLVEITLLEFIV